MLSVTSVTCPRPISGFSHSCGGQCHMPRQHPTSHTKLRQQEKGRNRWGLLEKSRLLTNVKLKRQSHPSGSPWGILLTVDLDRTTAIVRTNKITWVLVSVLKNQTKQTQLWSQMIHTWIISALNKAGNTHITTRLFPGKCTEVKQGHALPAAEWRLDGGRGRHGAAGNWTWVGDQSQCSPLTGQNCQI